MTNRSLKLDSMKQETDSSFLEGYLAMHKKLVGVRISVTNKEISTIKTIYWMRFPIKINNRSKELRTIEVWSQPWKDNHKLPELHILVGVSTTVWSYCSSTIHGLQGNYSTPTNTCCDPLTNTIFPQLLKKGPYWLSISISHELVDFKAPKFNWVC